MLKSLSNTTDRPNIVQFEAMVAELVFKQNKYGTCSGSSESDYCSDFECPFSSCVLLPWWTCWDARGDVKGHAGLVCCIPAESQPPPYTYTSATYDGQ